MLCGGDIPVDSKVKRFHELCHGVHNGVPVKDTGNSLGERIKRFRQQRHWRQQDLAQHSGVRQALISELEHGRKSDTTGENLRKLAVALGVTMDALCGLDAPETPPLTVAQLLCQLDDDEA
jgi:transcriptional regulator with XRE-family HTH domain